MPHNISKAAAVLVEYQGMLALLPDMDRKWMIDNGPRTVELLIDAVLKRPGRKEFLESLEAEGFTKLISTDVDLIISATNGKELLSNANDTFSIIGKEFKAAEINEKSQDTLETQVEVYEVIKPSNLSQMFTSIFEDVRMLDLSQSQIKEFIRTQSGWLNIPPYPTFFLFKSFGIAYVAQVNVLPDQRKTLRFQEYESEFTWQVSRRPRIVVPKIP
jgi:hypothetical protein